MQDAPLTSQPDLLFITWGQNHLHREPMHLTNPAKIALPGCCAEPQRGVHMAVLSLITKASFVLHSGTSFVRMNFVLPQLPQTINTVPHTTKMEENDNYQPKTSHAGFFSLVNCMRLLTWPKISNGVKARNEYVLAGNTFQIHILKARLFILTSLLLEMPLCAPPCLKAQRCCSD